MLLHGLTCMCCYYVFKVKILLYGTLSPKVVNILVLYSNMHESLSLGLELAFCDSLCIKIHFA